MTTCFSLPSSHDLDTSMISYKRNHEKELFFYKNHEIISKKFNSYPGFSIKFGKILNRILWLNDFIKNFIDLMIIIPSNGLALCAAKIFKNELIQGNFLDYDKFPQGCGLKQDCYAIKNAIVTKPLLAPIYILAAALYIPLKMSLIAIKLITTIEKLLLSAVLLSIDLLAHTIIHIPTIPKILYAKYKDFKKESEDSKTKESNKQILDLSHQ